MTRILIMGNSHVGALKHGWSSLKAEYGGRVSVEFFVASSPVFVHLAFDGASFGAVAGTGLTQEQTDSLLMLNNATTVDTTGFDRVLLAGMSWAGTEEIVGFLTGFAVDGLYEAQHPQRLTRRGFDMLLRGAFARVEPDAHWLGAIAPRLGVMLRPMPSERVRTLKPHQIATRKFWSQPRIDFDRMRPLLDRQAELASAWYGERGISLLPQPEETRAPCGLTLARYDQNAGDPAAPIDIGHKNASFGRLCLSQYLDRVAPAAGST